MQKKIKKVGTRDRFLIVSDLDGTLLNSKSQLSLRTVNTVKALTDLGHVVVLATGRPYRASYNFYDQLHLDTIMVNHNGAKISHPYDSEFEPIHFMFKKDILIELLKDVNIVKFVRNILVENNYGSFFFKTPKKDIEKEMLLEHFHVDRNSEIKYIESDFSNLSGDIFAALIQLNDNKDIDELIYNIKSLTSTLIARSWSIPSLGQIIEINSIFSTKGTALKFLSSYYGIPLDRCMTFGDGDNDHEMLTKAYYGFAMRNGSTTAKLSARFLTRFDNEHDGVAWELENFFNLKIKK